MRAKIIYRTNVRLLKGAKGMTEKEFKEKVGELNAENLIRYSEYLKEIQDTSQQQLCPYQKERNT